MGSSGDIDTLAQVFRIAEHGGMNRTGLQDQEYPAKNLIRFRKQAGLSMRRLGEICEPPLDHVTIQRIEKGAGYTGETLRRLAAALKVSGAEAFFFPEEIADYSKLDDAAKQIVSSIIQAKLAEASLKEKAV
jgi:Helix-turn-helix.